MEIKQEFDKSYLYIEYEEDDNQEFLIRMLTENRIEGVVECIKVETKEEKKLRYDISNMISIKRLYENKTISLKALHTLIAELGDIYKEGSCYFLSNKGFLLDPEWIFYDMFSEKISLIYIPDYEKEDRQYAKLSNFILDRIDTSDEACLRLGYDFYSFSKEENFSLSGFTKRFDVYENNDKQDVVKEEPSCVEEEEIEVFIPEETENNNKKGIVLFVIGMISIICYILIKDISVYANIILVLGILCMIIAIIFAIMMFVDKRRKKEDIEIERNMADVSINEYFGETKDEYYDEKTVYFDTENSGDYRLEWEENGSLKKYRITRFPVKIGKLANEVDCRIDEPSISRVHAKIEKYGSDLYLFDMASTNGTRVNNKYIKGTSSIKINKDSEILLGNVSLRIS